VHEYLFLSLCWMDITNLSFGLIYLLFYFFMHPIDNHHNTTFFLKLIGSNISLWCYFMIDFCLIFSGICCPAASSIVSDKGLFGK
jgi:hypothetical protein